MMTFNEWEQTLTPAQKEAWDLDEATVSLIEDRFYFREICDDEKMTRFFQRTLDTVRDRYNEMIRVETIKFDPLVFSFLFINLFISAVVLSALNIGAMYLSSWITGGKAVANLIAIFASLKLFGGIVFAIIFALITPAIIKKIRKIVKL